MSHTQHKRGHDQDLDLSELGIENFINKLQEHGGLELAAAAILEVASRSGVSLRELKKHKASSPAFSSASWNDVALRFGLDASKDLHQLDLFSFPLASLPPSFHREVMKMSAKWLDVYQERAAHDRESARVRLMDAWHVPICALFRGRIIDRPESSLPETPETSGGEVEHEVYMIEGILLLVVELKLKFKNTKDNTAQVLLELASTYKLNSKKDFHPQPAVYAVLTDLQLFYFFCYDGSKFTRTHDIIVSEDSRPEFLAGMRTVSDHLFSILLEAYIGTLKAIETRSAQRGENGDVSQHNSAQVGKEELKAPGKLTRLSLGNWSKALAQARAAQTILVECKFDSLGSWEEAGRRGLSSLNDSVILLSKIGSVTDWDMMTLDNEIEKILLDVVKKA